MGGAESEALALGQGQPGQLLLATGSHTAWADGKNEPEPGATHCEVWPEQLGKQGRGLMAAGHRTDRRLRGWLSGRHPLAWGRCENNDGSPPQFGFY